MSHLGDGTAPVCSGYRRQGGGSPDASIRSGAFGRLAKRGLGLASPRFPDRPLAAGQGLRDAGRTRCRRAGQKLAAALAGNRPASCSRSMKPNRPGSPLTGKPAARTAGCTSAATPGTSGPVPGILTEHQSVRLLSCAVLTTTAHDILGHGTRPDGVDLAVAKSTPSVTTALNSCSSSGNGPAAGHRRRMVLVLVPVFAAETSA